MVRKAFRFTKEKIFIIIFAFCVIIVLYSLAKIPSNKIRFREWMVNEGINKKSIVEVSEKYDININYPVTKNNKVNKDIKDIVESYIDMIKIDTKYYIPENNDDKFLLNVDYNITRANKDLASMIFLIKYNYLNNEISNIFTRTYNLNSGEIVELKDFFDETVGYFNMICELVKDNLVEKDFADEKVLNYFIDDINYTLENSFDGYSVSSRYLSIYFNSNKIFSKFKNIYEIKIPWEDVSYLLNKNIILAK